MMRNFIAGLALGLLTAGAANAADTARVDAPGMPDDQHPVYVQIIVKACPQAETPFEPINQGKSYDEEKPMTIEERKASLVGQGCIDVPVPMEWTTGQMTPEACRGHAGYIAAMELLQQRQDLAGFPAVGAWSCIVTDHQVVGAASQ
ncbi:MAG TPA: hypothetical protein VJ045_07345 [Hyphomicrobiaceae bacterium]|jgi:hypothetical protein|nr:hypothetical protein [Hyphomicrobiaceae bacterium]